VSEYSSFTALGTVIGPEVLRIYRSPRHCKGDNLYNLSISLSLNLHRHQRECQRMQRGVALYGAAWCGVAWRGVARRGVVWSGMA